MSEFGQDDGFYSGGYMDNQGQGQDISYVQGFDDQYVHYLLRTLGHPNPLSYLFSSPSDIFQKVVFFFLIHYIKKVNLQTFNLI